LLSLEPGPSGVPAALFQRNGCIVTVNPTDNTAIRTRKKAKRVMPRDRRYSQNREEIDKADFGATECKLGEDITECPQDQQMAITDPLGRLTNSAPVCVITA